VLEFASRVDAHLVTIAASLRDGTPPPSERLRRAERTLAGVLDAARSEDGTADVANAIADACDRITDSADTLAHLLRQRRAKAAA
jgi:hypothetical protein